MVVRSTTFLFTTLCTSIQNFGENRGQTIAVGMTFHRNASACRDVARAPRRARRRRAAAWQCPAPRRSSPRAAFRGRSFPMAHAHRGALNLTLAARTAPRFTCRSVSVRLPWARLPRLGRRTRGLISRGSLSRKALPPCALVAYKARPLPSLARGRAVPPRHHSRHRWARVLALVRQRPTLRALSLPLTWASRTTRGLSRTPASPEASSRWSPQPGAAEPPRRLRSRHSRARKPSPGSPQAIPPPAPGRSRHRSCPILASRAAHQGRHCRGRLFSRVFFHEPGA
jgi:hypothetical protein